MQLVGLTEVCVNSSAEIMQHLIEGSQSRTTGATAMNNQSSRSHAIFTIQLQRSSRTDRLPASLVIDQSVKLSGLSTSTRLLLCHSTVKLCDDGYHNR